MIYEYGKNIDKRGPTDSRAFLYTLIYSQQHQFNINRQFCKNYDAWNFFNVYILGEISDRSKYKDICSKSELSIKYTV